MRRMWQLQQQIRNFHFKVFKANTPNKMDHTMWKTMKHCPKMVLEIVCIFVCGHLSLLKDVGPKKVVFFPRSVRPPLLFISVERSIIFTLMYPRLDPWTLSVINSALFNLKFLARLPSKATRSLMGLSSKVMSYGGKLGANSKNRTSNAVQMNTHLNNLIMK